MNRTAEQAQSKLDAIWLSCLPITMDRLQHLEAFVTVVRRGTPTAQQRQDALNIAHKFAGSLGVFGYPLGSEVAHSLEVMLRTTPRPDPETLRHGIDALRNILGL